MKCLGPLGIPELVYRGPLTYDAATTQMARRCVPWVLAFVLLPFTMAIDNGVGLTPPSKLEGLFRNQTFKHPARSYYILFDRILTLLLTSRTKP